MVWDAVYQLADAAGVGPGRGRWSSLLLGGAALAGAFIPAWSAAHTPPATLIAGAEG